MVEVRVSVVNTSSRRRREGVQGHQYTRDTDTQRSTMKKQGKSEERNQRREASGFLFFPCLFIGQLLYLF